MRIPVVTFVLVALAAPPRAADAQFGDYRFQGEASFGVLLPGFNTVFSERQIGGGTREIKTGGAVAVDGRFLILWPGGLHGGITFALAPDIPLEVKMPATHVGVARRLRLSVAMGGQTPKIPGTPVRFRGGFNFGFARYTFVEDPGMSLPRDAGTNFVAGVSMGWDVQVAQPVSLITDLVMSLEDGQTESLASFLIHVGLAVRFVEVR